MIEEQLSDQEKLAFVRGAITKMAEYSARYLIGVIALEDSAQSGRHVGTGFRCTLAGRPCVVTADHVLRRAAQAADGIAITTERGQRPWQVPNSATILRLDEEHGDLAVIQVSEEYQQRLAPPTASFWSESQIDDSGLEMDSDFLFIHGFPGKSVRFTAFEGGGITYRSLPYGAMQRTDDLPAEMRAHEFAIDYDPQSMQTSTGAAADLIEPDGLSGSACWRIGARGMRAAQWQPEHSRLVGIATRWDSDKKSLLLTKAALLVDFVNAHWRTSDGRSRQSP